jgi:hypothetical protein
MGKTASPREIVDGQLRAYNDRNVDDYCVLFARDAVISQLHDGTGIAHGIDAIRTYYTMRFKSPTLRCTVLSRLELGNFVIDHEQVIGLGEGTLEVIAIYEVRDALIRSVRFIWP